MEFRVDVAITIATDLFEYIEFLYMANATYQGWRRFATGATGLGLLDDFTNGSPVTLTEDYGDICEMSSSSVTLELS